MTGPARLIATSPTFIAVLAAVTAVPMPPITAVGPRYTCDGKLLCPWLVYNKDTKVRAARWQEAARLQESTA